MRNAAIVLSAFIFTSIQLIGQVTSQNNAGDSRANINKVSKETQNTASDTFSVNLKKGHALPITQLCISKDNKYIISTTHNENATLLWDLRTGKFVRTFIGEGLTKKIGFMQGSKYVIRAGGSDRKGQLIIWNVKDGKEEIISAPAGLVLDFNLSPDEKNLAAISMIVDPVDSKVEYTVEVFDLTNLKLIKTFSSIKHEHFFNVRFVPETSQLLIGGYQTRGFGGYNFLKIYDLNTSLEPKLIKIKESQGMRKMNISPDGNFVCESAIPSRFYLINLSNGKMALPDNICEVGNNYIDFTNDSKSLIVSEVGKITIRNITDAKIIKTFSDVGYGVIAQSHDGKYLASIPKTGTEIRVIDTENGNVVKTMSSDIDAPFPFCLSRDGTYFIYGGEKPANGKFEIKICETGTGRHLKSIEGNEFAPSALKQTKDGRYLIGYDPNKKAINFWDLQTQKFMRLTIPDTSTIGGFSSASFSGNERYIVACGNKPPLTLEQQVAKFMGETVENKPAKICIWETNTGNFVKEIEFGSTKFYASIIGGQGSNVIISMCDAANPLDPTNGMIGENIQVKNYNVETESSDLNYQSDYLYIYSTTISQDGSSVAICYISRAKVGGMVQIWDAGTAKMVKEISLGKNEGAITMCFSSDSKFLAVGMLNNNIQLFETSTGNLLKTFKGHTGAIISTTFSPENNYLYSVGLDLTIKMWEIDKGGLVASYVRMKDPDDFIIYTPDNYYTATRNSIGSIYFRDHNQIIPFQQFDLQFNRPDIVLSRIGLASPQLIKAYNNAYQKRMKRMGYETGNPDSDYHLPEVSIINEEKVPLFTKEKSITLSVEATDDKYIINSLNIYVNDSPLYGIKGIDVKPFASRKIQKEVTIELSNGENNIQFSVLNEKGVESKKATINIQYIGDSVKQDMYLMTIGVSKYKNPQLNLVYSVKDGRDLIKTFTDKNKIFNMVYVDSLFDQNATKEKIAALKKVLVKSKVDDIVVVSISGHGFLDNNFNFYFGTYDIDESKPNLRGLSYEEFESLFDGIPARKKVLLIDACHSGEVDKEETKMSKSEKLLEDGSRGYVSQSTSKGIKPMSTKEKPIGLKNSFELMQELFADLSRGSGTVIISAASGKGFALESPNWNNGVFTYCVINGLKNKKANLDGKTGITISELRKYVMSEVGNLTNGEQTPTSRKDNLDFDFRIW